MLLGLLLERLLELLVALRGVEIGIGDPLHLHLRGERLGPLPHQEDVRRLLLDQPGEGDGILDRLQRRHRAAREVAAVHDGGVELVRPLVGVDRPLAGVEQRIVLQEADHLLDGVQAGAPLLEDLLADLERLVERAEIFLLLRLGHGLGDRPGAAVDGDRPLGARRLVALDDDPGLALGEEEDGEQQ